MAEQRSDRVGIAFDGTGLEALGWGFLGFVLSILIIPAAWGAVFIYRWFVSKLNFSNGVTASFEGRAKDVWVYFAVMMLLSFVPQLAKGINDAGQAVFASIALHLLVLPITAAIGLKIVRWFLKNVKLSSGTPLSFTGRYGVYLGWTLLISLSIYTIVGWAWAVVGMTRWMYRNVDAGKNQLVFTGTGWQVLWRMAVVGLAGIFIIPIPWMAVWYIRWFTRNTFVQRVTS